MTTPDERQPDSRDLRDLLRRRIRAAIDGARQSGGEVSAEELEAIDRLKRLIDVSTASNLERTTRRLAVSIVVIGVIACIVLLEMPMRHASIALDASVSYVGFRSPDAISLLAPQLPTTEIEAPNFDSVSVSGRVNAADTTLVGSPFTASANAASSMSLAAIDVAPFAGIRIGAPPKNLELSVGDAGSMKLELNGTINLLAGAAKRSVQARSGAARLWYGKNARPLSIRVPDSVSISLTPVARIDSLQLYQFVSSDDGPRVGSTILEGKLDIPSVDDASTKLGPDEALRFEGIKGDLKAIQLHSGALVVSFTGTARRIVATNGVSSHSLMPSMFAFLKSQHTAELVWTAIAWVVVTALSILRWWRRPDSSLDLGE